MVMMGMYGSASRRAVLTPFENHRASLILNKQCSARIETNELNCSPNQLTVDLKLGR